MTPIDDSRNPVRAQAPTFIPGESAATIRRKLVTFTATDADRPSAVRAGVMARNGLRESAPAPG